MSTIYMMTAVNLFAGDHDPTKSKHLTISELKLPDLSEIYVDHHPGGGRVGVEFEVGVNKLEPTFKLAGHDPDLMVQFGLGGKQRKVYTAYGVILDKRTGREFESKAIIEARLGNVAPDAFQRGELQGHEYALNEVMHYELWFDDQEKFHWDFFTNVWRVNGNDENAGVNRILRIPGAA
ncbi:phage major tail tube protein [Pararhizobium haloflavum]|uniref:phage major tail tube protein n=1 Tax=Pararhizobium haloflavum TaxID=2037914 RepID=UPI000C19EDB4|nr:phage major tail tube protein [Pararhizobium haloflavum]